MWVGIRLSQDIGLFEVCTNDLLTDCRQDDGSGLRVNARRREAMEGPWLRRVAFVDGLKQDIKMPINESNV